MGLTRAALGGVGVTLLVAVPSVLAPPVAPLPAAPPSRPAAAIAAATTAGDAGGGRGGGPPYATVTTVLYGGGPLPPPFPPRLGRAFPRAALVGAYGLTEATSSVSFVLLRAARSGAGWWGWAGGRRWWPAPPPGSAGLVPRVVRLRMGAPRGEGHVHHLSGGTCRPCARCG